MTTEPGETRLAEAARRAARGLELHAERIAATHGEERARTIRLPWSVYVEAPTVAALCTLATAAMDLEDLSPDEAAAMALLSRPVS